MAAEAIDVEKLVKSQREAVSNFFGAEIPQPVDRLFVVFERIREEKLLKGARVLYLPRYQLAEGVNYPGQRHKLSPYLYTLMREKLLASNADQLLGLWAIIDTTKRPHYNSGKQMYPDTERFKDLMASLRDAGKIKVPDKYKHVPKPSRFALSPDEIDGNDGFVSKAIADIIGLEEGEETTTLLASTFNYVGNLHPELGFGNANTSEWLRNKVERGGRLYGGSSDSGGLSFVIYWLSVDRHDRIGFRLQFSFPAKA